MGKLILIAIICVLCFLGFGHYFAIAGLWIVKGIVFAVHLSINAFHLVASHVK